MPENQLHEVYLAIGANLGDREHTIELAIRKLQSLSHSIFRISPVYNTPPMGPGPQDDYLNLCIHLDTSLLPHELLSFCKGTEQDLGRIHRIKWGPREIDIDILIYGNTVMQSTALSIPHPGVLSRAFVLQPLSDLAPDLILPGTKQTIMEHWHKFLKENNLNQMSPISFSPIAHALTT